MNGLNGVVMPVQVALTDRVGEALFVADGFQGTNRLANGAAGPASDHLTRVEACTVDAFCAETGVYPRVFKIDTEGAELMVLRGAREAIRASGPDLVCFVELHPSRWSSFGYSREDLQGELSRQGLTLEAVPADVDVWHTDSGLPVKVVRDRRA
jgi:FkbM family methyltransferase